MLAKALPGHGLGPDFCRNPDLLKGQFSGLFKAFQFQLFGNLNAWDLQFLGVFVFYLLGISWSSRGLSKGGPGGP